MIIKKFLSSHFYTYLLWTLCWCSVDGGWWWFKFASAGEYDLVALCHNQGLLESGFLWWQACRWALLVECMSTWALWVNPMPHPLCQCAVIECCFHWGIVPTVNKWVYFVPFSQWYWEHESVSKWEGWLEHPLPKLSFPGCPFLVSQPVIQTMCFAWLGPQVVFKCIARGCAEVWKVLTPKYILHLLSIIRSVLPSIWHW